MRGGGTRDKGGEPRSQPRRISTVVLDQWPGPEDAPGSSYDLVGNIIDNSFINKSLYCEVKLRAGHSRYSAGAGDVARAGRWAAMPAKTKPPPGKPINNGRWAAMPAKTGPSELLKRLHLSHSLGERNRGAL
jgi:hypothetical protein